MKALLTSARWRFFRAAGIATIALAGLMILSPRPASASGLLIADGGLGGVLEVESHEVKVTLNNGIAVTEATQVFRNTEDRAVEALYVFPVPKGASVSGFCMWINGKEMVGEVLEKQKARQIYESYKPQRRDPGILEQKDYKTFEMRIFPIPPRGEQRVRIAYYQELDIDNDWATYVYPLATVGRTGLSAKTRGKFSLTLEAKSEIPIERLESPSHEKAFVFTRHSDTYVQASLETTGADLNRDVVLAAHLSRPRTGLDWIASRADGEDGFFCLTLAAGEELKPREAGMDYVFVLDISGSMADDGKLGISKRSLDSFVRSLSKDDRFEVITFNVQARTLFRSLSPATDESKAKGVAFLASQEARGGTILNPAISAAYKYKAADRPLNVVILSDGMTEQNEQAELLALVRARPSGVRAFCIGVGNEVNRPLMEQVANDTGGLCAFLSSEDNLERQAQAFRRKLLHPAASGLQISFEGGNIYDLEPPALPNLYHGMPVRLYGRYKEGGKVKASLRGDVNGVEWKQDAEVDLPAKESGNSEIERMWARHRISRLQKEADRAGSRDSVRSEIVRLGEAFSIATEYTSFLVLENDAEFQRWKIDRRNTLRLARDRNGQEEIARRLEGIRKKAQADLGPVDPEVANAPAAAPKAVAPAPLSSSPAPSRGWDLNLGGGGGGGGAIDPVTGGIALALASLALLARRKRPDPGAHPAAAQGQNPDPEARA